MKKSLIAIVSTIVVANCFVLFSSSALANTNNSTKVTCYSTYDEGTTHFTNCNGCSPEQGTNLRDQGKCN